MIIDVRNPQRRQACFSWSGRIIGLLLTLMLYAPLAPGANISIQTVPIGNAPNNFHIGKYEVTNTQYVGFLNAKAASDSHGLYNTEMSSSLHGGISRSGSSGSYSYSIKPNMGNKPVNFVSWYDAVRFVNWLHNGQGNGDTEMGAYDLDVNIFSFIDRQPGAKWFLPDADNEWWQAAHDDPANGAFLYPTGSDDAPAAEAPPGGSNSANYASAVGTVTDVGAYVDSASPYGTFDQGGNVWEWNEDYDPDLGFGEPLVRIQGGGWHSSADDLFDSFLLDGSSPFNEFSDFGFRVATVVPEPSGIVLAALGLATAFVCCWPRHMFGGSVARFVTRGAPGRPQERI